MMYKGYFIQRLFPSGMYETHMKDRFIKANTLQYLKRLIDEHIEEEKEKTAHANA